MIRESVLPAAQYLRASTEHQQYSIANQAAVIASYAELQGFKVVETYAETDRSGLAIRRRKALKELLSDVISGAAKYSAILVYDVSRWGRFQDTDESAHYEFVCKSAGVPVHYCAESFANDGTFSSLVMKALKRTMAAEYSRELGARVLAGQRRLAEMGFRQGGKPGYGLRRLLVSSNGTPKVQLESGERKSIATDRVILAPGPVEEIEAVREIFRLLIKDRFTVHAIARLLNERGVKYGNGVWDYQAVHGVLSNPKYNGCAVYGRTSRRLLTPEVKTPRSEWIVTPGASETLIDANTFAAAQQVLENRTVKLSDQQLLDRLNQLLAEKQRLSLRLIKQSPTMPSPSTYRKRFGSLRQAYERIGYHRPEQFERIALRCRTQALRNDLLRSIKLLFPDDVTIMNTEKRRRPLIRLNDGRTVSVLIARSVRVWKDTIRWCIDPALSERPLLTLLARLDEENQSFFDFHVLPNIDRHDRVVIRKNDNWLLRGRRLPTLSDFLVALHALEDCRS